MKDFADLFTALDQSTKTSVKVAALAAYFDTAAESDKLWTIALFSGRRPKRAVTTTKLREWAAQEAGLPLWLFEESYPIVGDLAETIALILPKSSTSSDYGLTHWINALRDLSDVDEPVRKLGITSAWAELDTGQR
ncbi:MAG: ATP-dependent DNA ligase, partial [Pseudomonadota bacterium]